MKSGLSVRTEVALPVIYEKIKLDVGYRIDILVEDSVIIEIKSVKELCDIHYKQIHTYLKLSDKRLGLLVNFNTSDITSSIKRIVNHLME